MISLLLIYFIGKYFYDLAIEYNKSKWGWAIAGIISYYSGVLIISFIVGMIAEISSSGSIESWPRWVFVVMEIPSGIVGAWILYWLLKKKWGNKSSDDDMDGFLDAGL